MKKFKVEVVPEDHFNKFSKIDIYPVEASLSDWVEKGIFINDDNGYEGGSIDSLLNYIKNKLYASSAENTAPEELIRSGVITRNTRVFDKFSARNHTLASELKRFFDKLILVPHDLKYQDFMGVIKDKLKSDKWNRDFIASMLKDIFQGRMYNLRKFLRNIDPELKVRSYDALRELPLEKKLDPGDFASSYGRVLTRKALKFSPIFRSKKGTVDRLTKTTKDGLFMTTKQSRDAQSGLNTFSLLHEHDLFELLVLPIGSVSSDAAFKIAPLFRTKTNSTKETSKKAVKALSEKYKHSGGDYIFYIDSYKRIMEMIEESNLTYSIHAENRRTKFHKGSPPPKAFIETYKVNSKRADEYRDEEPIKDSKVITSNWRTDDLKELMRYFDKKIGGRKSELIERTINLLAELYREIKPNLDEYFSHKKFIRVPSPRGRNRRRTYSKGKTADIWGPLSDKVESGLTSGKVEKLSDETNASFILEVVGRTILIGYILMHLRGNSILDGEYNNEAYEPETIFHGIIEDYKNVDGILVQVNS